MYFFQTESIIELETRLFSDEKATDCLMGVGARATRHWEWAAEIQWSSVPEHGTLPSDPSKSILYLYSFILFSWKDKIYYVLGYIYYFKELCLENPIKY